MAGHHQSADGEQLLTCFVDSFFPPFLLNCVCLHSEVLLFVPQFSPSRGMGNKQMVVWCFATCFIKTQQEGTFFIIIIFMLFSPQIFLLAAEWLQIQSEGY